MQKAQNSAELDAGRKAIRVLNIAGTSCFFGWMLITLFSIYGQRPAIDAPSRAALCLLFLGGVALGTALIRRIALKRLTRLDVQYAWWILGSAIVGVLPALFSLAEPLIHLPLFVWGLSASAAGCASAFFLLSWNDMQDRLKLGIYMQNLSVAICLGNLLFVFGYFLLLPGTIGSLAFILLAASAAALGCLKKPSLQITCNDKEGFAQTEDETEGLPEKTNPALGGKEKPKLDTRIRALFILFGIAFGIAWSLIVLYCPEWIWGALLSSAVAATILIFITHRISVIHDRYVTILIRASVVVLGLCFLMAAFSSSPLSYLALLTVCVFWQLFLIVDFSLLMRHVSKHHLRALRHMATGFLSSSTGIFAGFGIGVLSATVAGELSATAILSVAVTAALVIAGMALFPFDNRTSPESSSAKTASNASENERNAPSWASACSSLAADFGLSQREEEILLLLARGRSNKAIAKALFISENTAKTHVYNMYRKLEVHSRQEVLDLLEKKEQAQESNA